MFVQRVATQASQLASRAASTEAPGRMNSRTLQYIGAGVREESIGFEG